MFNFNHTISNLALSAMVAMSAIGGAAQAAPTTCAIRNSSDLVTFTCDHSVRTNANGHKVNDVTFFADGKRNDMSIIFWMDGDRIEYAETFTANGRQAMNAYIAKNGSWCIDNNGYQLCIH